MIYPTCQDQNQYSINVSVFTNNVLNKYVFQGPKGSKGDMGEPGMPGEKGGIGLPGLPVSEKNNNNNFG